AAAYGAGPAGVTSDTDACAAGLAEGEEMYKWVGEASHNGLPRSGTMGPEGLGWMARAEAERSRLLGKSDVQLWERAVEAFGYGAVYLQALCRWRLTEALLAAGDGRRAGEELRGAYDTARALKATRLMEGIEQPARRARD